MLINSLRPNTTRAEAARLLGGTVNEFRHGRLQTVMNFYVPYWLFQVRVTNGRKITEMFLAVDSVKGNLDLYGFGGPPTREQCAAAEGERSATRRIDERVAAQILEGRIKRETYLKGFFRVRDLTVSATSLGDLHVPYWVGVYRRRERVRLEVIDAVRSRFEGAKLREVVTEWFLAPAEERAQQAARKS